MGLYHKIRAADCDRPSPWGVAGVFDFGRVGHAHHPEIELTSDSTAKGVWYLQDIVIDLDTNTTLRGAGFYHDEYEKVDGQWKIKHTGYIRTYEEVEERSDKTKLTTNIFSK